MVIVKYVFTDARRPSTLSSRPAWHASRVDAAAVIADCAVRRLFPLSHERDPAREEHCFGAVTRKEPVAGVHRPPPMLVQPLFAEEFGWDGLAHAVARVYFSLPPPRRAITGVFADTYADAGAIDFFGKSYGLPPALSEQNSYYLWGTHGYDGRSLIFIGATRIDLMRRYFRSITLVATYGHPYTWVVEGPTPIYLCADPIAPLNVLWPKLRWYGA